MYQFGHVYALQQELLDRQAADWFRACELWHTARHEGIALNVSHYTNIARQAAGAGRWEATLAVLAQMRRDAIRPDANLVGLCMAACVRGGRSEHALELEDEFVTRGGMKPNDLCNEILSHTQGDATPRQVLSGYSEALQLEASGVSDDEQTELEAEHEYVHATRAPAPVRRLPHVKR
jgi:hypothetical protein